MIKRLLTIMFTLFVEASAAASFCAEGGVVGVFGTSGFEGGISIAVYVPLNEGQLVTGVRWFNNDSEVNFPALRVAAGSGGKLQPDADAMVVAIDMSGTDSAWSEVHFETAYVSADSGLYFILEFPPGIGFMHAGSGGGPGVGFRLRESANSPDSYDSWISADGATWDSLEEAYQIAIEPVYASNKFLGSKQVVVVGESTNRPPPSLAIATIAPSVRIDTYPNPFNPETTLSFELSSATNVVLAIHDLRGLRVATLFSGQADQGQHATTWNGRGPDGRIVASGVYVARLTSGTQLLAAARIMLLK